MATIPTFGIPPTPDIRTERPSYFNQRPTGMPTAAFPKGFQPYDPTADQWQNEVPDQWPEIEAQLKAIIERGPGHYYEAPAGQELTPEQQEHNKMLMAWKSPAGLSAIETGKYREFQQKQAKIDRTADRIIKLENQLIKLGTSKEKAPENLLKAFERRYNTAVEEYEKLTEEDSGYPKYTGEGKLKLAGEPEKKGVMRRGLEIAGGLAKTGIDILKGQQFEDVDVGLPESDLGEYRVRELTTLTKKMQEHLPGEEGAQAISQINQETKNPDERAEKALQILSEKAPDDPEIQEIKRARTAQKVAGQQEGLPITERFQQWQAKRRAAMPTNQQYIEGGGMPGMLLQNLGRAVSPIQQPLEQLNTLDARVRQAMENR